MREMDPICFKVPRLKEETVRVENWDLPYFYDSLHYHEECQLTYILEGQGVILVGDKLEEFREGDLLLIGKNTPHVLLNSKEYYEGNSSLHARAISIFFSKDTFHQVFNQIPETAKIEEFLEQAQFGIRIKNHESGRIGEDLKQLVKLKQVPRIILFMKILDLISRNPHFGFISSSIPHVSGKVDNLKLKKIFDYITMNFEKRITLQEVAGLINLTPTAFCRFFKLRTNKTFSQFLVEVRINQACKMLSNGNFNVTETFFSCGYNNSSNFHRHFRQHTGLTPSEYKDQILNKHQQAEFA
ncbi:MAG: AraC family transcriptional regulator [Porphyromonadaceae bacterium]|nr:MAG: AraC family transcriptional regulator [Porphyromonadaceae bacterium]